MPDITLLGHKAPVGRLAVEPTDDGTQVRFSVTVGGPSELSVSLCLSLVDAEAVSGLLSDAIEEVAGCIDEMTAEAETIINRSQKSPDEDEPAGPMYAVHLEPGKPPMVIEFEDIPF